MILIPEKSQDYVDRTNKIAEIKDLIDDIEKILEPCEEDGLAAMMTYARQSIPKE